MMNVTINKKNASWGISVDAEGHTAERAVEINAVCPSSDGILQGDAQEEKRFNVKSELLRWLLM